MNAKAKSVIFTHDGFKATLTVSDDQLVKDALTAQAHVTDRYLKIEPAISTAFRAPACYEKGTTERTGLLEYLKTRHPAADRIAKLRAEQEAFQAKGAPDAAHEKGDLARLAEARRDNDIQNAIRAFKRYYEAGQAGKRERVEVSPRQRGEQFTASLKRYFKEGSQWSAADQRLAKAMHDAVQAILTPGAEQIAAPRTVGAGAKQPSEVKTLSPAEIAAIQ